MIHTKSHITIDDYINRTIRKFKQIISYKNRDTKFWKCIQCGRVNEEIYIYCNECGHIETLD